MTVNFWRYMPWGLALIFGLAGFSFAPVAEKEMGAFLQSFIMIGAFFSSFAVAAWSFFMTSKGVLLTKIKKEFHFSTLMKLMKFSTYSFLLLAILATAGFFFPVEMPLIILCAYTSMLTSIFGFSLGNIIGITRILSSAGEHEEKKILERNARSPIAYSQKYGKNLATKEEKQK